MTRTATLRFAFIAALVALLVATGMSSNGSTEVLVGGPAGASGDESSRIPVARKMTIAKLAMRPVLAAQSNEVTLTLLHSNDGESKLLPDLDEGFPGVARFTNTLQELGRSTNADILLRVTAGDNFLASKELSVGLARPDEPLFDSIALSGLYEAMALGNHDFDLGPDVTARFIEGFSPPVTFVAANIDVSDEPALQALADAGLIAGSTIFTDPTTDLDVGIIGAITPQLPNISSPRDVDISADVAGAVNAEAQALEARGIDRIVLVSHLQGIDEERELVGELRGVDVVVAGGGDELLKNPGDTCMQDEPAVDAYPIVALDAGGTDVPVVTTPGGYRCIGRLDITFDDEGVVIDFSGASVGVPLDADPEEYAVEAVEQPLAEAVGALEASVVGDSEVDLDGRRSSVRSGPTNVGELLADAVLEAGLRGGDFGGAEAEIAIQNGGGIRNDSVIPAGDVTEADTFDIAPFPNFVVTLEVPRDRLKQLLEVAVASLPEDSGTYPQIAGFTLEIDAAMPAREVDRDGDCSATGDDGSRVRTVTLDDGTVLVRDGEVIEGEPVALATVDFLARGGDCYPLGDLEATPVGVSYQQALAAYIDETLGGDISEREYPEAGGRTTFVDPAEGASTEPEAEEEAEEEEGEAEEEQTAQAEETEEAEEASETVEQLPRTGLDAWLLVIVAATAAAGGAMVVHEARRAGWISLLNRLRATRSWQPD